MYAHWSENNNTINTYIESTKSRKYKMEGFKQPNDSAKLNFILMFPFRIKNNNNHP
jgi:hypothetical protein